MIETIGDEEPLLGILFALKTEAAGFPEMLCLPSKLHGVTYHKTVIFIVTTLRTSNLTRGNNMRFPKWNYFRFLQRNCL